MDLRELTDLPSWEWPDGSRRALLDALTNPSAPAGDRVLAAELAGDLLFMSDEIARALIGLLRDPDASEEIRSRAAISLGPPLEAFELDWLGIDEEDEEEGGISRPVAGAIRSALHGIYLDPEVPSLLRRRALESAVRGTDGWQEGAVRAAYHSGDPEWRVTAVYCMKYLEGFEEEIVAAFDSDDPDVELYAVEAAGTWEIDAVWPHLTRLVASEGTEKSLLLAAAHAIACIRPEEAFDTLEHLLEAADDEVADTVDEALSMAEILEEIRIDRAADPLTGPLRNGHRGWEDEMDPY